MTLLSELFEAITPLPDDLDLDTMMVELEKRMSAAKRGMDFAKRLKNPLQKKKHTLRMLNNLRSIQRALNRTVKQLEQFNQAESSYVNAQGYDPSAEEDRLGA